MYVNVDKGLSLTSVNLFQMLTGLKMRFNLVFFLSCAFFMGCQDQLVSLDLEEKDADVYHSKSFNEVKAFDGVNSTPFTDTSMRDVRAISIHFFGEQACPGKPGEVIVTPRGRATLTSAEGECGRNPNISIEHPQLGLFMPSGLVLIRDGD